MLVAEAQKGRLTRRLTRTTLAILRLTEGRQYRLTSSALAGNQDIPGSFLPVLRAIEAATPASPDGWIDEGVPLREVYSGYKYPAAARHKLKLIAEAGFLDCRDAVLHRRAVPVFTLSQGGSTLLQTRTSRTSSHVPSPTRPPQQRNSLHHLLLVLAANEILVESNGVLLQLLGDEDLRSQQLKGKATSAGDVIEALPDGLLHYQLPSGERVRQEIEILVSKYTSDDIVKKYNELGPRGTRFFTASERLSRRVVGLGCPCPELLR